MEYHVQIDDSLAEVLRSYQRQCDLAEEVDLFNAMFIGFKWLVDHASEGDDIAAFNLKKGTCAVLDYDPLESAREKGKIERGES